MKQGQLNSYFKKLTLVPESSNGDERAGAAVEARPAPPLQKQPAARPKVLAQTRPSTADGVLGAIDSCLRNRVGVLVGTQKEKLVNMNLDGASVNMGVYNGVGAIQRARCGEQVTVTHCINHNLELALMDLRKDEPYLDTFEKTLKVLFSIYQFYCVLKLNNISFYYQYYYSNIFTL